MAASKSVSSKETKGSLPLHACPATPNPTPWPPTFPKKEKKNHNSKSKMIQFELIYIMAHNHWLEENQVNWDALEYQSQSAQENPFMPDPDTMKPISRYIAKWSMIHFMKKLLLQRKGLLNQNRIKLGLTS